MAVAKWLREYLNWGRHKGRNSPRAVKSESGGREGLSGTPARADTELMLRAYRLQKEQDFEDPYSGRQAFSLRRVRAAWHSQLPEEPPLYRSNSERAKTGNCNSSKHRLIKVDPPSPAHSETMSWSHSSNCKKVQKPQHNNVKKVQKAQHNDLQKDTVVMRDDYSDPFDAKNELKNQVVKKREVDSNGYMEPYEAQRMMAELDRQENQKKEFQLYDTPYELEQNNTISDTEGDASYLKESKLPQDDTRPAKEYDQPWEWSKIAGPTLAAQVSGFQRRQSAPFCDRYRQLRPPGRNKHEGLEFRGIIGETVNPNTPLEKQVWYHGAISRTDAENLLRLCKECSYLIRNSQSKKNNYSLSLKSSQGFMHMKLTRTKDKYILGENSLPFDSVPKIIHHYSTRRLPIKGAEHLSLLYPVPVRTL
ncbi:SH2 domain-containing adapter protein F-like isoform X1 [Hemiscyllium ocellatum]|uniref:SH2 domain-containing adapter protein F-like isoform X1 n=1 Tax=Hemiscyllium ocellatum TaxID=170820 RepID=UPI0029672232|nr:SH2 domain-containing adapter protein F-like isoform X1 [Hemiscyllium ocellatum]